MSDSNLNELFTLNILKEEPIKLKISRKKSLQQMLSRSKLLVFHVTSTGSIIKS